LAPALVDQLCQLAFNRRYGNGNTAEIKTSAMEMAGSQTSCQEWLKKFTNYNMLWLCGIGRDQAKSTDSLTLFTFQDLRAFVLYH
jgi:hypothetical protein